MQTIRAVCQLALIFLLWAPAWAQVLPTASIHWKVNQCHFRIKIDKELRHTWEMDLEREALSDQGTQVIGSYSKSYNSDLETMVLEQAYTLKADGRRVAVQSSAIQTQTGVALGASGASWPNVHLLQVTFPDVQKGDRTHLRFTGVVNQYALPNWMHDEQYIEPTFTWDDFSYTVQAPVGSPVQLIAEGLTVERSENAGQTTWKVYGKYPAKTIDTNIVNGNTSIPRLLLSSYSKQEQLIAAYNESNNQKLVDNADIQKLATAITQGHTTPRAQAQAIYDWIRGNIRYVASYIGQGGYVPHDLAAILTNRYGDCKDHQLLFQALLKAVGIDAVPALINAGMAQFEFLDLPVGFDHVITYIPSLQLFADATSASTPFGHLPWGDADRPVAVALPAGPKLMRTPATTAQDNTVSSQSVWTIKPDGKADLDIKIQTTGYAAVDMQNQLEKIPAGMSGMAIQEILKQSGWKGQGFAQYPPVQRKELAQTLSAQVELRSFLSDPTGGSIAPNPRLALQIYTAANLGIYTEGKREFATYCTPISVTETFELRFHKDYKINRVPKNFETSHPDGIAFTARYALEGNTLKGQRTLTLSQPRHACSTEQYATRLPTLNAIAQHLRSNVLFMQ